MDQTILVTENQSQHDILIAVSKVSQLRIEPPSRSRYVGTTEKWRRYTRVRYRVQTLIKSGRLELIGDGSPRNLVVRITPIGMREARRLERLFYVR